MSDNKYSLIIFDLDGTLVDTSKNIYNCVRYAEKNCNLTKKCDDEIKTFFGPSPKKQYQKIYGIDEEQAILATKYHRQYSSENIIYESSLYKDVYDVLKKLKEKNYKLAVATLKNQQISEKLLKEKKISCFFDVIIGMDEKESFTKVDVIELARKKLAIKDKTVYVGDTIGDKESAEKLKIDFIGVTYGFGFTKNSELNNKINCFNELLNL